MAPRTHGVAPEAVASSIEPRAAKRKLLDESDSESEDGRDPAQDAVFTVNEEFARRFEHNKKREEKQRCQFARHQSGARSR